MNFKGCFLYICDKQQASCAGQIKVKFIPNSRFRETGLSPPVKVFSCPFQGGASFVDRFFYSYASCWCVLCCRVLCSLVVTCWERADLLAVVCVVFCHFPKCALVHIRIKSEVGAVKLVQALR